MTSGRWDGGEGDSDDGGVLSSTPAGGSRGSDWGMTSLNFFSNRCDLRGIGSARLGWSSSSSDKVGC